MHNYELVKTMCIATALCFTAMASIQWVSESWDESRFFWRVSDRVRTMTFDLSCSSEGHIIEGRAGNCLETNGYRFIRVGLAGTVIARIASDGPMVVYRRGTDDDLRSSSGIYEAWRALLPD